MSIDGIGRPPIPPGGAGSVSGSSTPAGATEGFRVESGAPGAAAESTAPASWIARLERGELSVDQYLDLRVAEAVAPLAGRLGPEQLETVRGALRAQLETDPVLIELVQRATGTTPSGAER